MKTITITLTLPEADHILYAMEVNQREGWYTGNKAQYWNRHERITDKIDKVYQEVVMENKGDSI